MSKLDDAITDLTNKVAATVGIMNSADVFIAGVPALIAKAKQDALDAGATEAQLKSLTDLGATLTKEAGEIHDAIEAQSPGSDGPEPPTPTT